MKQCDEKRMIDMEERIKRVPMDQFKNVINIFTPCMDDFLYVYNVPKDYYYISPNSMDRFMIPAYRFHHVFENMKSFVFPFHMTLKISFHYLWLV